MRIGVKWGVIFGVAICVWTIAVHLLGWYSVNLEQGERADIAAIVLPIAAIGLAIAERRRVNAQRGLTIAQGMQTGMIVGLVSIPISAGFLWFYHHHINPNWVGYLVEYHRAEMSAAGASSAAIAAKVDQLQRTGRDMSQLTGAVVGTTLLSAVLSLIFSLVLRRAPERSGES